MEDQTIGKVKNALFGSPNVEIRDTVEMHPSNVHSGLGIVYDSQNPGNLIIK